MPRWFQFSLRELLLATGLVALAFSMYLAATHCKAPWSMRVFVGACAAGGAAAGSLFRQTRTGALFGLLTGIVLVIYAIITLGEGARLN